MQTRHLGSVVLSLSLVACSGGADAEPVDASRAEEPIDAFGAEPPDASDTVDPAIDAESATDAPPARPLSEYRALAESIMTAHPDPFENPGPYSQRAADGFSFIAMNAVDDPAYLPDLDLVRGANAGFDIFLTVDTSAGRPGAGEIDGHGGTGRPEFEELLGIGRGDRSGDYYILGDEDGPYYTGKTSRDAADDDLVYIQQYEVGSIIRLHGRPTDYLLVDADNPNGQVRAGEDGESVDIDEGCAIFYVAGGTDDLIGHIDTVTASALDLANPSQFEYAVAPSSAPVLSGPSAIAQLGGAGVESFAYVARDEVGNLFQVFVHSGPDLAGAIDGDDTPGGSFYVARFDRMGRLDWLAHHGTEVVGLNAGQFPWFVVASGDRVFVAGSNRGPYGGPEPAHTSESSSHGFLASIDAETGRLVQAVQYIPEGFSGNTWAVALDPSTRTVFATGGTSDNTMVPGVVVTPVQHFPDTSPYVVRARFDDLDDIAWIQKIAANAALGRGRDPDFCFGPMRPDGTCNDLRLSQLTNEGLGGALFVPGPGGGTIFVTGYESQGAFCGDEDDPRGSTGVWLGALGAGDGTLRWCRRYGSTTDHQYPYGLVRGSDGFLYVAGQTAGSIAGQPYLGEGDGFVLKIDPADGALVWARHVGTAGDDDIHGLDVDGDTLVLGGTTWGAFSGFTNAGQSDVFAARLSLDGELLGVTQTGTAGIDWTLGAVAGEGGTVIVSGSTEGSLAGPHRGGVTDVFLARLRP